MDFAIERARSINPGSDDRDNLLEISWLYDRIVKSGSQISVIDLAYELVLPEEFVGECVSTATHIGYLAAPKRETFGRKITLYPSKKFNEFHSK